MTSAPTAASASYAYGVFAIWLNREGESETCHDACMAMKVTTVRFSETLYVAIEEQARREGVSAAQFIREAAILRLGQLMAEQGSAGGPPRKPVAVD